MHLGFCSIFGKGKNTRAEGVKISQHPACMNHAILHGKSFSNPLLAKKSTVVTYMHNNRITNKPKMPLEFRG